MGLLKVVPIKTELFKHYVNQKYNFLKKNHIIVEWISNWTRCTRNSVITHLNGKDVMLQKSCFSALKH